jgi:hypothetical protein
MGFCRTNLFKRLESSGQAFLLSLRRHILRNALFIYALENGLDLPIGTQEAEMLDTRYEDGDTEGVDDEENTTPAVAQLDSTNYQLEAQKIYEQYRTSYKKRFKWIRPSLFHPDLLKHLRQDVEELHQILANCGEWQPQTDAKLEALYTLLTQTHPEEKVLIFSQFADTVDYLAEALHKRGVAQVEGVTGQSEDPTAAAWRFSPVSNQKPLASPAAELRVLIATDVLSEGQNLQDAHLVVNYDLPWAIIRLIQRAGRVDRIGQKASEITCYTFWPAEGVERLIRLRDRLQKRLKENAEVVGTDEAFFEEEASNQPLSDLYHEKSGVLDEESDQEVDLVSYAFQIWKNATDADPGLAETIAKLPDVAYSARAHTHTPTDPAGALVYIRTVQGGSALAWVNEQGQSVTESQRLILDKAACSRHTPAVARAENHHELVQQAAQYMTSEQKQLAGHLSGVALKAYERLKRHLEKMPLLATLYPTLPEAIHHIYTHPLQETARHTLTRQLRSHITDESLAELVTELHKDGRLCIVREEDTLEEPQIICSLGLVSTP